MTTTETLFRKNKELAAWWARTIDDPNFEVVLLYVRSQFLELYPDSDLIAGASRFENLLKSIGTAEETAATMPTPGLHHDLEIEPDAKTVKPKKSKS